MEKAMVAGKRKLLRLMENRQRHSLQLLHNLQLKKMKQNNLKPLDSTLAALSVSCSRALELDLAEAFLNQIAGYPHLYPYGALLAACDEMNITRMSNRV
ncbi:pentatricopeptide repeat-containing protein At1g76280 isoform X4 [Arachis ipaensis]|uniref:pentatricopeptide repeat-containing protein At1g76280 isoform X4 n=1 Tax=Arachis ipaensis TaxID=130454 RepID=UPI000A2B6232|nr:pentatricopeptide repeat-containing protein At1g76280 isoform X4 [Arachis ipaensis]